MKKCVCIFFLVSIPSFGALPERLEKHVILPRQFHIGQEFIYDGVSYTIQGFDQEKNGDCEQVTLVLENPITFGLEFARETLILTLKQGTHEKTGTMYNTHLLQRYTTYHWKTYLLGLLFLKHFNLVPFA